MEASLPASWVEIERMQTAMQLLKKGFIGLFGLLVRGHCSSKLEKHRRLGYHGDVFSHETIFHFMCFVFRLPELREHWVSIWPK